MTDPNNLRKSQDEVLELTTDIVSSFASNNQMSATELSDLIRTVHSTLAELSGNVSSRKMSSEKKSAEFDERPEPAVPINASVTGDAIICLEDGKSFKTLKRHLRTVYGMTPAQYRARWDLPKDYPMVAPNYSALRSQTAKRLGLGRKSGVAS